MEAMIDGGYAQAILAGNALATMHHTIAVNKLLDRGSLSATTIVTNLQDFITVIAKGLGVIK